MSNVKTNSIKAWLLATRPKTLTGALVPVAIALSLAWHDSSQTFQWLPAILCLLFAGMMQIDANLINDYYDFKRGIDREDRLGPERACAQGWVSIGAMQKGLAVVTFLSAIIGLPLVMWGGYPMIAVGAACIVFCFLYTTWLSGKAMGDLLVLVFFGWVPVCVSYYLQTHTVTLDCFLLGTGCGLAIDNLLMINNFRDRDTDKAHGKITLVTLLGKNASLALYLVLGFAAYALQLVACRPVTLVGFLLPCLYLAMMMLCFVQMKRIDHGRELNSVLGKTSISILLYGVSTCLLLLIM